MWAIFVAIAIFLAFLPGLASRSVSVVAICLVLMNFGFAFVYVTMPGLVNRCAQVEKSVANGVYLTFYYVSAAIGSYFPLLILEASDYHIYLACLFCIASVSLLIAFALRNMAIK